MKHSPSIYCRDSARTLVKMQRGHFSSLRNFCNKKCNFYVCSAVTLFGVYLIPGHRHPKAKTKNTKRLKKNTKFCKSVKCYNLYSIQTT